MLRILQSILIVATTFSARAKDLRSFADSIRIAYKIPALAYAVVSADSVYEMHALGVRKINTKLNASLTDRYRIGSNTKAITGFIAAQLVKQGKIAWNTKFFDLFPELKPSARKEYHHLTLLNLLTFRTKLFRYTYTFPDPHKGQFSGTEAEQRYQFTKWFMQHEPAQTTDSVNFSNLGYVAAGLMLEKASGTSYAQLVADLGKHLGISFGFGRPNATDVTQTWGHDAALQPEARGDDYKLSWLLPAGNINCTLPGYARFIQLQLQGLQGRSALLSKSEFHFLHYGLPRAAIGWFPAYDDSYGQYSWHIGNPGTFLAKVYVFNQAGKAFILLANAQTDGSDTGLSVLYEALKKRYGR